MWGKQQQQLYQYICDSDKSVDGREVVFPCVGNEG